MGYCQLQPEGDKTKALRISEPNSIITARADVMSLQIVKVLVKWTYLLEPESRRLDYVQDLFVIGDAQKFFEITGSIKMSDDLSGQFKLSLS